MGENEMREYRKTDWAIWQPKNELEWQLLSNCFKNSLLFSDAWLKHRFININIQKRDD